MYFVDKNFVFPTKLKLMSKSSQFWRYWHLKFSFLKKKKKSVFENPTVVKGFIFKYHGDEKIWLGLYEVL